MKKSKVSFLTTLLACVVIASGCSHIPKEEGGDPRDPWEPMNRKIFSFNQVFDKAIAKPVTKGYEHVTTEQIRIGIRNIFLNTREPGNAVNSVFQGKVEQGILAIFRLMINSTAGVAGIFDVAEKVDIPKKETDFSDTLAVWDVPAGPYFVIPFGGPTTVRDGLGRIPNSAFYPTSYIGKDWFTWPWRGLNLISTRSQLMPVTELLQKSVDPYVAVRNAYLQHRDSSLKEGITTLMKPDDFMNPFDYDEEDDEKDLEGTKKETKEDKAKENAEIKIEDKIKVKREIKPRPANKIEVKTEAKSNIKTENKSG